MYLIIVAIVGIVHFLITRYVIKDFTSVRNARKNAKLEKVLEPVHDPVTDEPNGEHIEVEKLPNDPSLHLKDISMLWIITNIIFIGVLISKLF